MSLRRRLRLRCVPSARPRFELHHRAFEHEPAVAVAVDRIDQPLRLHLQILEACRFDWSCDGSWPACCNAVLLELLLLLDEPAPRVLELRIEEFVGGLGQHLAVAQVLLDEQRGSRSVTCWANAGVSAT